MAKQGLYNYTGITEQGKDMVRPFVCLVGNRGVATNLNG